MASDWKVIAGFGVVAGMGLLSAAGVYISYYMGVRRGMFIGRRISHLPVGKSYEVMDDPLVQYMVAHNHEDPVLAELRRVTIEHSEGEMTTSIETGRILTLLCKAVGAQKVIDIGVFTGCSSYSMALGLKAGGRVVACDISAEYTEIGRPYWNEGGVADKIDLRIQPALKTLQDLVDNGETETFDLVFIDACKKEYPQYFQTGLTLLRSGGFIIVDNALWHGLVTDPYITDQSTQAIREINRQMSDDERVEYVLLNIADGLGVAVKK